MAHTRLASVANTATGNAPALMARGLLFITTLRGATGNKASREDVVDELGLFAVGQEVGETWCTVNKRDATNFFAGDAAALILTTSDP